MKPLKIDLSPEHRALLERWVRAASTPQRLVRRARIILLASEGKGSREIAGLMGISRPSVIRWRHRFVAEGPEGIVRDRPRPGPTSTRLSPEKVAEVVHATLHTKPEGRTHWSSRTMARAQGISLSSIQRIWKAHNLRPHKAETFKHSTDEQFVDKLVDVVGLYLNPPEKALVLCVDEKSQIQALERTRPILPMKEGMPEKQTHDYRRHGTTTLFGALSILDGRVTGACYDRHTHQEFLSFLQLLDREIPSDLALHLVVDNYATHKHANVRAWLAQNPRFHLHFTPTSSSWLNMIECWFSGLTTSRLRRGSFASVPEVVSAIEDYIRHHNETPRPFVWKISLLDLVRKLNKVYSDS